MGRGRVLDWLQADKAGWGTRPDDFDQDYALALVDKLRPLFDDHNAWFRTEVQGWDNLPDEPVLLVSNHSGGTVIPDVWGFGSAWYRHFGGRRPVHPLAHELVFATEGTGKRLARCGIIKADRANAVRCLTHYKRDVFVLPGGDRDTWRPWKDRYKVTFAGRKGYAKLALQAGVPIVPVAHAGAHDTLIVLTDGQRLARKLRFQELFRAEVFPVHLSLPFGLQIGPWPHLPPPTKLRYRIGEPIRSEGKTIEQLDQEVRDALQGQLDTLRDEQPSVPQRLEQAARTAWGRLRAA